MSQSIPQPWIKTWESPTVLLVTFIKYKSSVTLRPRTASIWLLLIEHPATRVSRPPSPARICGLTCAAWEGVLLSLPSLCLNLLSDPLGVAVDRRDRRVEGRGAGTFQLAGSGGRRGPSYQRSVANMGRQLSHEAPPSVLAEELGVPPVPRQHPGDPRPPSLQGVPATTACLPPTVRPAAPNPRWWEWAAVTVRRLRQLPRALGRGRSHGALGLTELSVRSCAWYRQPTRPQRSDSASSQYHQPGLVTLLPWAFARPAKTTEDLIRRSAAVLKDFTKITHGRRVFTPQDPFQLVSACACSLAYLPREAGSWGSDASVHVNVSLRAPRRRSSRG